MYVCLYVGIPHIATHELPYLIQRTDSIANGMFYVDANQMDDHGNSNNNCGVTYEANNHLGISSTALIVSLKNLVIANNKILPAIHATTYNSATVASSIAVRAVYVLTNNVIIKNNVNTGINIKSKDADIFIELNSTIFESNVNGGMNIVSSGSSNVGLKLMARNVTSKNNQSPTPGSAIRFVSSSLISTHSVYLDQAKMYNNIVTDTSSAFRACQL
jgi:hypothetical protein